MPTTRPWGPQLKQVAFQLKARVRCVDPRQQLGQELGIRGVGGSAFVQGLLQVFEVVHQLGVMLGGHLWPEGGRRL